MFGLAFMVVLTFLYHSELGAKALIYGWAIIILAPFLQGFGVNGWFVFVIQICVMATLYIKTKI